MVFKFRHTRGDQSRRLVADTSCLHVNYSVSAKKSSRADQSLVEATRWRKSNWFEFSRLVAAKSSRVYFRATSRCDQ